MKHTSNRPDVILTFFVKDHHCHPITDPELKRIASSCNQKGSVNLFQHMSELKWTRRHKWEREKMELAIKEKSAACLAISKLDVPH